MALPPGYLPPPDRSPPPQASSSERSASPSRLRQLAGNAQALFRSLPSPISSARPLASRAEPDPETQRKALQSQYDRLKPQLEHIQGIFKGLGVEHKGQSYFSCATLLKQAEQAKDELAKSVLFSPSSDPISSEDLRDAKEKLNLIALVVEQSKSFLDEIHVKYVPAPTTPPSSLPAPELAQVFQSHAWAPSSSTPPLQTKHELTAIPPQSLPEPSVPLRPAVPVVSAPPSQGPSLLESLTRRKEYFSTVTNPKFYFDTNKEELESWENALDQKELESQKILGEFSRKQISPDQLPRQERERVLEAYDFTQTRAPRLRHQLNQKKHDFLEAKLKSDYPYSSTQEKQIDLLEYEITNIALWLKPQQDEIGKLETEIDQIRKLLPELRGGPENPALSQEERRSFRTRLGELQAQLKALEHAIAPAIKHLAELQAQHWDATISSQPLQLGGIPDFYLPRNPTDFVPHVNAQLIACQEQQQKEAREGKKDIVTGKPIQFQPAPLDQVNVVISQATGQSQLLIDPATQQPHPDLDPARNEIHGSFVGGLEVGIAGRQGNRSTMEDAHLATYFTVRIQGVDYPVHLFGVFDGHGGAGAAHFAKERFQKILDQKLREQNPNGPTLNGIGYAIEATCLQINQDFKATKDPSGTTATIAAIFNNRYLYVANVGDARTVLNHNGTPFQLSEDASPDDPKYAKQIHAAGGTFSSGRGPVRVNDLSGGSGIAVARAIGDPLYGEAISASPTITVMDLGAIDIDLDSDLILCCDGVFDVATTAQITGLAQAYKGQPAHVIATLITQSALNSGSTDNVSSMVINLRNLLAAMQQQLPVQAAAPYPAQPDAPAIQAGGPSYVQQPGRELPPPALPPQAPVSGPSQPPAAIPRQLSAAEQQSNRYYENIEAGMDQQLEALYQKEMKIRAELGKLNRIPEKNRTGGQKEAINAYGSFLYDQLPKEKIRLSEQRLRLLNDKLVAYLYQNEQDRNIDQLEAQIISLKFHLAPLQRQANALKSYLRENRTQLSEEEYERRNAELRGLQRKIAPQLTYLEKQQAICWDAKIDKQRQSLDPSRHPQPGSQGALYLSKDAHAVEQALRDQRQACDIQQEKESKIKENSFTEASKDITPELVNFVVLRTSDQAPLAIDPNTPLPHEDIDPSLNETHAQKVGGMEVGISGKQGARPEMEDAHLATEFTIQIQGRPYPVLLFGVFDGHGGGAAAQFARLRFQKTLDQKLRQYNPYGLTTEGIAKALEATCLQIDLDFRETKDRSGTTATVAMILNEQLWVANVGDARTVLNNGGRAQTLSTDMKPSDPKYAERIRAAGGELVGQGDRARINSVSGDSDLGAAGTIGDLLYIGASASSEITMIPLSEIAPGSAFILCCDGVYDVATTEQVVNLVQENKDKSAVYLATLISLNAVMAGSRDNISAIVGKFPEKSSS